MIQMDQGNVKGTNDFLILRVDQSVDQSIIPSRVTESIDQPGSRAVTKSQLISQ